MKKQWVVMGLLMFAAQAAWAGGEKGSGGGTAEAQLLVVADNLATFVQQCGVSPACGLTSEENTLIQKIWAELISRNPVSPIEFRSEGEYPGFFTINGVVRAAKTNLVRGATIYVNQDLLYPAGPTGARGPISFAAMAGLLTHEYGHHQGVEDEGTLNLLGAKVQAFMSGSYSEVFRQDLSVLNFETYDPATGATPHAQLFQRDDYTLTDITEGLEEAIPPESKKDWLCLKPVGFLIRNLHSVRGAAADAGDGYVIHRSQGNLEVACLVMKDSNHITTFGRYQLRISVRIDQKLIIGKDGMGSFTPAKYNGVKTFEFFDCTDPKETRCH